MPCLSCQQPHDPKQQCPAQRPADEFIGAEVGSFRIVRALGRGGMGTVYLGEHKEIGSKVAIKVLHRHLSLDPEMVRRFHAEARSTNLIGHENIVRIYDFGTLGRDRYYMVMEYLEGQPLSALAGAPLEVSRAVEVLGQICQALAAAHRVGVVHRDLKPENVFLVQRRGETVKVLDFGIAKLLAGESPATRTLAGAILGTPEFMSPEQVAGEPVDARSDIYAVGIIGYLLLTGTLPFTGGWAKVMLAQQLEAPRPMTQLRPELPRALCEVVHQALAKKAQERFSGAAELGEALTRAMVKKPAPPPAPVPSGPGRVGLLTDSTGRRAVTLDNLSRIGAYVRLEEKLPALRERVTIEVQLPGGKLTAEAYVVQQVTPEQAKRWLMAPGVAVQFADAGEAFSQRFAGLLQGGVAPNLTREAEAVLKDFRARSTGGHYALLELSPDAEFSEIRRAVERALARLEPLKGAKLPGHMGEQLQGIHDRVNQARVVLGDPVRRAEHDGAIGNYRGVARCLAAGLRVPDLEACRRRLLANRNKPPPATELRLLVVRGWEASGDLERARNELLRALTDDPLHLELHRVHGRLTRPGPRPTDATATGRRA